MWHRDTKWANATGKMAPTDLLSAGLPHTFNLGKKKAYLQSIIKQGAIKLINSVLIIMFYIWMEYYKSEAIGLPWWRSGWESACQCRGHGFESWSGRIPHAAEQLGPWATTTEPARLEPVLRNKRGHDSERPVHRDEEWPPLSSTGESPRTETKTRHSQK